MTRSRTRWWIGVLLTLVLVGGCRDQEGPQAGTLSLVLSAPRNGDGALLVLVAGGPVTEIESSPHTVALTPGADGTRLLLIGTVTPGEIVRIRIPDLARAGSYRALVEQVADEGTWALADPAPYRITLHPHARR